MALHKILEMQCQICKAMSHPLRLEIVGLLNDGEKTAAELLRTLKTSKANLSKHTALLMHAGIIESRRAGREVSYRLLYPEIHEACRIMRSVLYRQLKKGEQLAHAIGPSGRH